MIKDVDSLNPLKFTQPFDLWISLVVMASIRSAHADALNILSVFRGAYSLDLIH